MPAHFEIHVADVERAKAFYGNILGWSFEAMPIGEDAGYHLILGPGIGGGSELTGGMMRRIGEAPEAGSPVRGCTLTFEVADVDACYTAALAGGGAEALPPADYPGIGRCAYCEDGEGNIFGMITPTAETN
ncbi:MAG: VOC family protein [Pseudomonadota bacterium]